MTTAKQYAEFSKTDPATFMGMRLAIAQGVINADAQNKQLSPDEIQKTFISAIRDEPYLKVAGTEKLVERYFKKSFKPQDLEGFYKSVSGKIDSHTLELARDGKAGAFTMLKIGNACNATALSQLHIESLTRDFQQKIRDDQYGITKDVTITPTPMTEAQVNALSRMEHLYRTADKLDIFHKPARQFLAHVDVDQETKFRENYDHQIHKGARSAAAIKTEMVKGRSEADVEVNDNSTKHKDHSEKELGHLKPISKQPTAEVTTLKR